MKSIIAIILSSFLIVACDTSLTEEDKLSVGRGEITVAVDESFKYIADAQIVAYQAHYPKTNFNIIYTPEQNAIRLMLNDSVDLAIVSRDLTEDEKRYYSSRQIKHTPGKMALDAIVLIGNKTTNRASISLEEISDILNGEENETKLVFDNSSSSNLNYMLDKFEVKELNRTNIFAAKGTEEVFNYIESNKKAIGVIGLNWISDDDDKRAVTLKERVNLIGIQEETEIIIPSAATLRKKTYPLVKTVYLHDTQNGWGVAKGFIRFACSQIGQLVVEKMGLQPYYLIPKNYEILDRPEIVVVE